MITNCKNGISSYEVHRAIGVTQKTAWFMIHRIRLAMQSGSFLKQMSGHVEVDETFIGGKARNKHRGVKARRLKGATGYEGKMAVMGWSNDTAKYERLLCKIPGVLRFIRM